LLHIVFDKSHFIYFIKLLCPAAHCNLAIHQEMATWGLETLLLKQEADLARVKDFVPVVAKGHSKENR